MSKKTQSKAEQLVKILNDYDSFYYEDILNNNAGESVYKLHASYDKCECTEEKGLRLYSSASDAHNLNIKGEIRGFSIEEVDELTDKLTISELVIMCRKGLALQQILK